LQLIIFLQLMSILETSRIIGQPDFEFQSLNFTLNVGNGDADEADGTIKISVYNYELHAAGPINMSVKVGGSDTVTNIDYDAPVFAPTAVDSRSWQLDVEANDNTVLGDSTWSAASRALTGLARGLLGTWRNQDEAPQIEDKSNR
jgi:hypothetical protein